MADISGRIRKLLPTRRRLIQLYAALLYNAHLRGFISGNIYTGPAKALCVPGLNCYSCPGATGACPLGALQNALASSGNRFPFYVFGILLLYGLILGRTVCGFLCPFGLIQELLHKIPTPKIRKNRFTRILSWFKYVILAVFVFCIPLWYAVKSLPLPAFCKYICPAGTLEGAVALLANPANADTFSMLGLLFTRKFVLLMLILLLCVFLYRAFCRFLCPLGAIYSLFSRLALTGVRVEPARCTDCGRCVSHCQMDIRRVGDHECIHCGECLDVCPEKAISFKAGRITLHSPEIPQAAPGRKRHVEAAVWICAIVLLAASLWLVNRDKPGSGTDLTAADMSTVSVDESIPVGWEKGMRAPDFTVPVYGSDTPFTLSSCLGQCTVINFWATWCGPCCEELPYFDDIYRRAGDRISIIAVHSSLVTDDVGAFLARYDFALPFALDTDGSVIASFGGSTMLPQTVVVDASGVIVYNAVGSMSAEKLEALLTEAGAELPAE